MSKATASYRPVQPAKAAEEKLCFAPHKADEEKHAPNSHTKDDVATDGYLSQRAKEALHGTHLLTWWYIFIGMRHAAHAACGLHLHISWRL